MIFVDTGVWVARVLSSDQHHDAAKLFFEDLREPLLTTDYVIDETLTLLVMRGAAAEARELGKQMFENAMCNIHWVTPEDAFRAWRVFDSFEDKAWSFTDCVSKSVMESLGIKRAAAFDQHFKQFGTLEILPEP